MALDVKDLERVFVYNNETLMDVNPNMTPEEVMNFYNDTYPDLINGLVQGPVLREDKAFYSFKVIVGTKG
jgi:PRTRC genetic system protein C